MSPDQSKAPSYRHQLYERLYEHIPQINADIVTSADHVGIPPELRGKVGLTGSISSCHALLRRDVSDAMEKAARTVIDNGALVRELREIVKDGYGDDYDVAPTNTCEAALWLSFDALATPPLLGRGENYRARYIAPYERHIHHQAAYGRPFPPKYKDLVADRGVTAGEMGVQGKRLDALDTVLVPLAGASYQSHGIRYFPVPLLMNVDAAASAQRLRQEADRHATMLSAVASMGYDTPGYGHSEHRPDGAPALMFAMGEIAREHNVPYIVDAAKSVPFIGVDPRSIGADVMLYSMDKAAGTPTGGLIIGREDVMAPIRRALGMHGARNGSPISYGKAAYVGLDAGKEYLVGLLAALKVARDDPNRLTRPVDELYDIVTDEFSVLNSELLSGIHISKSYGGTSVEVNYERTWNGGDFGFPIFSIEDMYAGTALLQSGLSRMGILPSVTYDGNISITPGLGTTDEDGNLIAETMRIAVRGLVVMMELICKHAGLYGYDAAA